MDGFFRKNISIGAAEILCRIPLIFTIGYLARSVGTELYGTWALVLVYQGLLAAITGLGLSSSLSRLASVAEAEKARGYFLFALKIIGIAVAAGSLFTWLLQGEIALSLGIPASMDWLLLFAVLLVATSSLEGALDAYFKARENIRRQIQFILIRTFTEVISVLAIFWIGMGGSANAHALAAYVALLFVLKILLYFLLVAKDRWQETEIPSAHERKAFFRYGLPMIPSVLVMLFVGQGDRVVLGHLVDKQSLGIYAFGATLASYLVFLGYAVYPLLLPRASRVYEQGSLGELNELFRKSQQVFLIVLCGALALIAEYAREIILFTAGPDFIEASQVFIILSVAVGVEQLFGVYQYVFHLAKKPHWVLWLNCLYAMLLIGAVYMAGRSGSMVSVPWTVLGVSLLFALIRYVASRRHIVMPVPYTLVAGCLMVALLTWVSTVVIAYWPVLPRMLYSAGVFIAMFAALSMMFSKGSVSVSLFKRHMMDH